MSNSGSRKQPPLWWVAVEQEMVIHGEVRNGRVADEVMLVLRPLKAACV